MNGVINTNFIQDEKHQALDILPKIPALSVSHAFKSYGHTKILNDLNMNVEQGTIYSLLGSSGCGKTTLLSCAIGIKSLDSGQISVFGKNPGEAGSGIPGPGVGYMPQEYALYEDFSIQESLNYFGLIYGMSGEDVEERSKTLCEFLNLPKPSRKIGTLSGGQKRRVSLAISMIHKPRLLILDEPTVGVESLLRQKIWKLLRDLVSNQGVTVIITTHYVEETRASDRIGMMQNGRLLVENNPQALMEQYNSNILEDIVLAISSQDEDNNKFWNGEVNKSERNKAVGNLVHNPINVKGPDEKSKTKHFEASPAFSFSRFRALFNKNLLLLLRNYIFLLFNFITPALQIVVACLCLGNDPRNLNFGIINHENPYNCNSNMMFNLTESEGACVPSNWSCLYLSKLADSDAFNLIPYEDEELALKDVEKGILWGYASFPQNFSQQLFQRQIEHFYPTNESIKGSTISLKMDYSSETIASLLQKILFQSFLSFSREILKACDYDTRSADLPLQFEDPVFGSKTTNYREYLAPSLLLSILFFLPLTASGISYIVDRKAGTLDRSMVAGMTSTEIMLANTFSQILVLFIQSLLSFLIMTTVFDIRVVGSFAEGLALCVLIGISGMSMGFLIASIVTEEIQAVIIAIGTFFPNFALSGIVWPVQGMPLALQYAGLFLPCTLASESMRSIITRGLSFSHSKVWPGFAATLGWIVIYWTLTICFHKLANRNR